MLIWKSAAYIIVTSVWEHYFCTNYSMSRLRVLLVAISLFFSYHQAQSQYSWFINFPGSSYTGAESISTDPDDNLLVIGNFENGVNVAGTNYSGRGSFLLKLTGNGTPLWHKVVRYGPGDFWHLAHVGTDGQGNAYISGTIPTTATVGDVQVSGSDTYNCLVAKFTPEGELVWTKIIQNVQEIYDMKVNVHGHVVLYTHHFGTVAIDDAEVQVGQNSFGMLLDSDGTLQWAKTFGNPLRFTTWPRVCALDNQGNTYFHGLYNGTLSVDGKQVTSTGGYYDFFFAKLDPQGICQWITAAERKLPAEYEPTNPPSGLAIERGALETDNEGNLYAGGAHWLGMKLGDLTLQGGGTFVARFNSAGIPQWAKTTESSNSSGTVEDIVVRNGRVYFAGVRPVQFYFSVYKTTGEPVNSLQLLPLSGDIASSLAVDSKDSLYMSGRQYAATLEGFVFKYNYNPNPPPAAAGPIKGPTAYCVLSNTIILTADVIEGAESYEWELVYNNQVYTFSSEEPQLELSLANNNFEGEFSVRIRGVNERGKGAYSQTHTVKAEHPLAKPQLLATCDRIYLDEPGPLITWYLNNATLSNPNTNQSILHSPSEGTYHVTFSNSCGSIASDLLFYRQVSSDAVFIPNMISPNDDEWNEFFIVDEKLESPSLVIYNRWGSIMYTASEYDNRWSGQDLSAGVYFYQLSSRCLSRPILGSLTILR